MAPLVLEGASEAHLGTPGAGQPVSRETGVRGGEGTPECVWPALLEAVAMEGRLARGRGDNTKPWAFLIWKQVAVSRSPRACPQRERDTRKHSDTESTL